MNAVNSATAHHGVPAWRRIPFLRWSFWRLVFGLHRLTTQWQVGDGREARLAAHVESLARRGDAADVIRVIDDFCYCESFMINIGDRKGAILDAALARANARQVLELGTYCGYSALRMAVTAPGARIFSIELSPENAAIARRIHAHAGVADRVTVIVGTLGDGGSTIDTLRSEHGFAPGGLDFVFLDHSGDAYLTDLQRMQSLGWLRKGAIVVADNVRFPGAPAYRAFMQAEQGRTWQTVEHEAHVEYQSLIRDLVLESELLDDQAVLSAAV